ncbi:MAG: hypothetical protein R3F40_04250 [Candidatus Competibacteraceae bacterium]
MCDHVLEHQLALFQSLQFKLVDQRILGQAGDHIVQIAMLCPQFDEPVFVVFDVTALHCGVLRSRAGFFVRRGKAGPGRLPTRGADRDQATREFSPTPNDRQDVRLGATLSISGKVSALNTGFRGDGR